MSAAPVASAIATVRGCSKSWPKKRNPAKASNNSSRRHVGLARAELCSINVPFSACVSAMPCQNCSNPSHCLTVASPRRRFLSRAAQGGCCGGSISRPSPNCRCSRDEDRFDETGRASAPVSLMRVVFVRPRTIWGGVFVAGAGEAFEFIR